MPHVLEPIRDPLEMVDSSDFLDPSDSLDPSQILDPPDVSGSAFPPSSLDAWYEFANTTAPLGVFATLDAALDSAETAQHTANRAMAAHLDAVRLALETARRHPTLYLHDHAAAAPDAEDLAVRAAAAELSMRLQIPAGTLRNRAYEATVLRERLPQVWARFADGVAGYADARTAVEASTTFTNGDARLDELDQSLADLIGTTTSAKFRQRVRTLCAKLDSATLETRHTRAYATRRVVVEHIDDGMSWVQLLVSSVDAAKIRARLDTTALSMSGTAEEPRTLDQLRADVGVAWLTGETTPTAANVEVIVTVPLLTIVGQGDEPANLDGVGPIDAATARQLFADAPSFLRLAVDPITSAPLDLDRTRYRPTKAQRRWLALRHGRCTRPGCNRLAVDSDIDHLQDWFFHGPTDIANLAPTCRGDHRLKHTTRFTVTKAKNGTVSWRSPTARTYTDPPPF
jgi:hypothetical protein